MPVVDHVSILPATVFEILPALLYRPPPVYEHHNIIYVHVHIKGV